MLNTVLRMVSRDSYAETWLIEYGDRRKTEGIEIRSFSTGNQFFSSLISDGVKCRCSCFLRIMSNVLFEVMFLLL